MKLSMIILLMLATLIQAKPIEKRAALPSFMDHSDIQRFVRENDRSKLCDLRNRLQNLLVKAENENDLNILEEGMDNLKASFILPLQFCLCTLFGLFALTLNKTLFLFI